MSSEISTLVEQTTIEDTDWYVIAVPPYRQAGSNRKISGATLKLAIDDARIYVQEEGGTPFAFRKYINFIGAAVTAVDNPGQDRVDVTVNAVSSPFYIENTCFVDGKYGSDITGTAESIDKPFATIQAATDAAFALTPTADSRALVVINPDNYYEEITMKNFVDYEFRDCTIGSLAFEDPLIKRFRDNSLPVDVKIYGRGKILIYNSSGMDIRGLNSNVTIDNIDFETFNSNCVYVSNGSTVKMNNCNLLQTNLNQGYGIYMNGGNVEFYNGTIDASSAVFGVGADSFICSHSRLESQATNAGVINAMSTAVKVEIKATSLVSVAGATESIHSNDASPLDVYCYGGCVATKAVDSDVTLLVGTVANNGFIVDANVI